MTTGPTPFEPHESGALLHGTKARLAVGDLLVPGRLSNYEPDRVMNHVYVTATLDAAAWGAEMAPGDGPGFIHIVEPTGDIEDDPNVTDKKFPGNPTRSYRSREPVRIVGELAGWTGHTSEQVQAMRDRLADLRRRGLAVIYDTRAFRWPTTGYDKGPRSQHLCGTEALGLSQHSVSEGGLELRDTASNSLRS